MKRAIVGLTSFCALSLPVLSQEARKPPAPAAAPAAHTEIRLFLKNGDKVVGIVRNNRFRERAEGKRFVEASPGEKGSGLRLWFVNGTKSEVFFRQEICVRHEVLRKLTEIEFRELAAEIEGVASEAKAPPSDEKKGQEPKSEDAPKVSSKEKAVAPGKMLTPEEAEEAARKAAEEAEGLALLQKFSPEAGWGEARLDAIKRRRLNDLFPTKEEAEFEKNYLKWKKAFDAAEAERLRQIQELQEKVKKLEKAPKAEQNSSG